MILQMNGKTTFYKNIQEFQLEIEKQYRRIYGFVKGYYVRGFTEVSFGIGTEFFY